MALKKKQPALRYPKKDTPVIRYPVTVMVPRDLLARTDALAKREERTRTKFVEMALRRYVEQLS